jgi:hypothetical protein
MPLLKSVRMRSICLTGIVMALCSIIAAAATYSAPQRVAVLDFTSSVPQKRMRPPKPQPKLPGPPCIAIAANCSIPAGRCGGILANPPLSVSLAALDKTQYAVGDKVVFTLRIENTGGFPVRVPIAVSVADLEPKDASVSYRYEPMEIWLRLVDHEKRRLNINLVVLNGSPDKPSTQIELRHGEWIEVRGKTLLAPIPDDDSYYAEGTISDMPVPSERQSGLEAFVTFWRGDILDFNAAIQLESYSCTEYEMRATAYRGEIDLVPVTNK